MPINIADDKKVTSLSVIEHYTRLGIDPNKVEFIKDYDVKYPTTKVYHDHVSGTNLAVIKQIPRFNEKDERIIPCFKSKSKGIYENDINFFDLKVDGEKVTLSVKDKQLEYTPQLFINDVVETFASAKLTSSDKKYTNNVLTWKSKSCYRVIKITEGTYRESWIFKRDVGKIEIKHNFIGDKLIRIGHGYDQKGKLNIQTVGDSEIFEGEAVYPIVLGGYSTYYVDASSVDGWVSHYTAGGEVDFSDLVNGAGTDSDDSSNTGVLCGIVADSTTNRFNNIKRSIFLFNTGALASNQNVYSAYISVNIPGKNDTLGCLPNVGLYETDPDSDTALVDSDYSKFGSSSLSSILDYGDIITGYNSFLLNDEGRSKIIREDISKFGFRNANYDVADTPPSWINSAYCGINCYFSDNGTSTEPKLVVSYREKTEYIRVSSELQEDIELTSEINLE